MRGNGTEFDVTVTVGSVPTTFTNARWRYQAPIVEAVLPALLEPQPAPGTTINISGGELRSGKGGEERGGEGRGGGRLS
jgi:hypothetical protein